MVKEFNQIREGESVVFWIRKHWIAYVGIFLKTIVFYIFCISAAVIYLLKFMEAGSFVYSLILMFLSLYMLGMWWWSFAQWVDEEFDSMVVTSERIIDITQSGLFSISQSEAGLEQIQDVKGEIKGFWNNILQTGSLQIQTAGRDLGFQIDCISKPKQVAHEILMQKGSFMLENKHLNNLNSPEEILEETAAEEK